jgi:hypothetical protein
LADYWTLGGSANGVRYIRCAAECPASKQLIDWIDLHGNGKYTQHAHPSKTLLDVEPGHVIVHKRTQYVGRRIKPYRTSESLDDSQYPWRLLRAGVSRWVAWGRCRLGRRRLPAEQFKETCAPPEHSVVNFASAHPPLLRTGTVMRVVG